MSIAYDCENIPPKEDLMTNNDEQDKNEMIIEQNHTTSRFNAQFQQKSKLIRELWTQNRLKLHKDNTQLLVIILLCVIAIGCSLAALTTNNWMCDGTHHFGLWNTCTEQSHLTPTNEINITTTINVTMGDTIKSNVLCAKQIFPTNEIVIEIAEQTRVAQVTASQGLIICGTILYVFSVVAIVLAYKFIQVKNLNSVRNALVTSMVVQIVSFFLQLIGFFLFVVTDRLSISVSLLFVYFGLAIFATNIINFITVEYKSYKIRQISI